MQATFTAMRQVSLAARVGPDGLPAKKMLHKTAKLRFQAVPHERVLHIRHAGATSSSSIELQRVLQMQQLLDDVEDVGEKTGRSPAAASSKPPHQRGFGRSSSSSAGGGRAKRAPPSKEEWQQLKATSPGDLCPCCSGLRYKDCCQPFLSGAVAPRSAPELVRARIAAARTGDVAYLSATTHSDSVLALGGAKNMASRYRRQCALFRANQVVVAGMAHCRGDFEGSWFVLTILQSTAEGELEGTKAPHLALLVRSSWQEGPKGFSSLFDSQHQTADGADDDAGGSARKQDPKQQQQWMFLKWTNQLPEHGDAAALVELLQQHVPELLQDADGSSTGQQQGSMTGRQLCFSWGSPWLSRSPGNAQQQAAGGGSGGEGWYVDLLQPAAERLGHGSSSGTEAGEGGLQRLLPPGVLSFDDLLAAADPRPPQRP